MPSIYSQRIDEVSNELLRARNFDTQELEKRCMAVAKELVYEAIPQIETLLKSNPGLRPELVLETIDGRTNFGENIVREAMWQLLDDNMIVLTNDRKLVLSPIGAEQGGNDGSI